MAILQQYVAYINHLIQRWLIEWEQFMEIYVSEAKMHNLLFRDSWDKN